MNLMFWKKKTGPDAGDKPENLATNKRGSLDFVAAKPDAVPEPSTDEPSGAQPPGKPGLAARLGSQFNGLMRRFRKAPAFRAEVGEAPPDAPEKPAAEPDTESSGAETPAEPGFAGRMKSSFSALVGRFRKTPPRDAGEERDEEEREDEERGGEGGEPSAPPAKPGLLKRVGSAFAAFGRELKAPSAPPAGEEEEEADSRGRSAAVQPEEEAGEAPAGKRSRKRLVIGVALLILLLAGIGIIVWPALKPPEKRWGTKHDVTAAPHREPAPEEPQKGDGALMRENTELRARIEALEKERPAPHAYAVPAWQGGEGAPSSVAGELTVGNGDPKAAAMTLKEAIEAMNAGTGDYGRKPAR